MSDSDKESEAAQKNGIVHSLMLRVLIPPRKL